jgi:hypothetical protein
MMQLTGERAGAAYLPFRNPAQIAFHKNLNFFLFKINFFMLLNCFISKINFKKLKNKYYFNTFPNKIYFKKQLIHYQ